MVVLSPIFTQNRSAGTPADVFFFIPCVCHRAQNISNFRRFIYVTEFDIVPPRQNSERRQRDSSKRYAVQPSTAENIPGSNEGQGQEANGEPSDRRASPSCPRF